MLHTKKLMGMHNKGTYTRVLTYAYTRIDIRVYAYRHTRIRKIRAYNTRMRSSDISELHCTCGKINDTCQVLSRCISWICSMLVNCRLFCLNMCHVNPKVHTKTYCSFRFLVLISVVLLLFLVGLQ